CDIRGVGRGVARGVVGGFRAGGLWLGGGLLWLWHGTAHRSYIRPEWGVRAQKTSDPNGSPLKLRNRPCDQLRHPRTCPSGPTRTVRPTWASCLFVFSE